MNENILQFGKCYIIEFNINDSPLILEEINEIEYNKLIESDRNLFELNHHFRRATELLLNYEEYQGVLKRNLEKLKNEETNPDFGEIVIIDINRSFNNVISSFKSFVEIIERRLKSKYGEDSKNYATVKSILSETYDKHFEYRFFSELRNYSQHSNYPIGRFELIKSKIKGNYFLRLLFIKKELLNDKRISKKFQFELSSYNDFFPIDNLVSNFYSIFEDISDKILLLEAQNNSEYINHIYNYMKKYPNRYKLGFCKIEKAGSNGNNVSVQANLFPQTIIKSIINYQKSD